MKILISGGGTGGHIYPGLAVARVLEDKDKNHQILFVGTKDGLEADIIPKAGYRLETIKVEGLPRKISFRAIKALLNAGIGLLEAVKVIKDFKPDIVLGTGGYVCGPVVLAASLSKIPTIIHEQNAYPGWTNKILARFVDRIAISNQAAKEYLNYPEKLVLTGNPIRPKILSKDKKEAFEELGLDSNKKIILVFGGSRGARSINQAVIKLYQKIRNSNLQLLHITGKDGFEEVKKEGKKLGINNLESGQIIVKPYLYNMEAALAVADLVICRAGATGLAEITACGIAAILIPYPYAAENHQEYNARSLEEKGAAEVILDQDLTGNKLSKLLTALFDDEQRLEEMSQASKSLGEPQAIDKLINLIEELVIGD